MSSCVPAGRAAARLGRKRYTNAEFVSAESHVRKDSESSHGPIVSVRAGIGRRWCTVILNASERSSSTLFRSAITASGRVSSAGVPIEEAGLANTNKG